MTEPVADDLDVLELCAQVRRSGWLPTARALAERWGIPLLQASALIGLALDVLTRSGSLRLGAGHG